MPGVMGDSLKAVLSLPGVLSVPEIGVAMTAKIPDFFDLPQDPIFKKRNSEKGVLVMRGSGSRSNRFYVDDMLIPFPFHLGDQASVLNNDYIRNVEVLNGTYSTQYGNATTRNNPEILYEATILSTDKETFIPMFNFGLEIKF